MSIRIMSAVWEHSQAKGTELLLLLALADYANDKGEAWPSISTLARKCRVGIRQVLRMIQRLEERDEITVMRRAGFRGTNRYILTIPTSDAHVTTQDVTSDIEVTSTSDIEVTSLVTSRTQDPSANITKPSIERATPKTSSLTEGQSKFLYLFGGKRFKTIAQKTAILTLEQEFGADTMLEAATWAAEKGMTMGNAVGAMRAALPKWGRKPDKDVIKVGA